MAMPIGPQPLMAGGEYPRKPYSLDSLGLHTSARKGLARLGENINLHNCGFMLEQNEVSFWAFSQLPAAYAYLPSSATTGQEMCT